jgi:hypothetical protein
VNFLEHGHWQPGGAGSEVPPRSGTGNQPGQGLIVPPFAARAAASPRSSPRNSFPLPGSSPASRQPVKRRCSWCF